MVKTTPVDRKLETETLSVFLIQIMFKYVKQNFVDLIEHILLCIPIFKTLKTILNIKCCKKLSTASNRSMLHFLVN